MNDARRDFTQCNGYRLMHHALAFGVVTHFHAPDKRKILAQGMPDKTVIGQDAAQVFVSGKNDAEQIKRL